jgi:hypothetical protein
MLLTSSERWETKYSLLSRYQNARKNHNIYIYIAARITTKSTPMLQSHFE